MVFEEDLRRLEPLIGKEKALRLWRLYQLEDADGRHDMEAVVSLQLEKQMGIDPLSPDQCLSVPTRTEAGGEYTLGQVVVSNRQLHPFGLREDEFIQHAAIFGRSGAGKTNTVALLIRELVRHRKPMMIFDWKRNYRDLLHGPDPVPLEVYTVGRSIRPLHFNPLIPPPQTDIKIRQDVCPPLIVCRRQLFDHIGLPGGNVIGLTGILLEIEQPPIRLAAHQAEPAGADGAPIFDIFLRRGTGRHPTPTSYMRDEIPVGPGRLRIFQQRHQAAPFDLCFHPGLQRHPGQFSERREQIND